MNLLEILRELKTIQPNSTFSETSRRAILASIPPEPLSPRRIFARVLSVTGSLVLAGALIFIIAGGLSVTKLAPQFSSIDPTALRTEAQAIDTQINLLNVNYAESTQPTSVMTHIKRQVVIGAMSSSTSTPITATNSTTTSSMSVDEVLRELSQ
jgi:hypothetical protein